MPETIVATGFDAPTKGAGQGQTGLAASKAAAAASPKPQLSSNKVTKQPWWHSQFNLMVLVFGLMALAAGLFIVVAPEPQVISNQASTEQPVISDSETPWTQSQLAEARTESQAILSNLLDSKKSLEQKGVEVWGKEGFDQALALAERGDKAYQAQDFPAAIADYQSAVDKMDSLFDYLPEQIALNLQQAGLAIDEGKTALAAEKFQRVLQLDQDNIKASEGLQRVEDLEAALKLLAEAKTHETEFEQNGQLSDLRLALAKFQQANQLDSNFEPIVAGLKNAQQKLTDEEFRLAMSDAYKALFAGRYSQARKAFAQALKIKPNNRAAALAMQQSTASDQNASIASLLKEAQNYEQQEQWASARSSYQTVLQRDQNQVNAKLGEIRSSARQQLDEQILEVLADPLSLSQTERNKQARKVLDDANRLSNKGPRVQQQITQLESALKQSEAAIKVSFVSDNLTQVRLQKVGFKVKDLGLFQNKNLSLKPGRYIATGVRLGFQDVRQEIELKPRGEDVQTFVIKCDVPLTANISTGAR